MRLPSWRLSSSAQSVWCFQAIRFSWASIAATSVNLERDEGAKSCPKVVESLTNHLAVQEMLKLSWKSQTFKCHMVILCVTRVSYGHLKVHEAQCIFRAVPCPYLCVTRKSCSSTSALTLRIFIIQPWTWVNPSSKPSSVTPSFPIMIRTGSC